MTIVGIDPSYTACGVSDGTNHIIVATKPRDDENAVQNLKRRTLEIVNAVSEFIDNRTVHVFIEGPMVGARDAMHLYELGWLMRGLHEHLPATSFGVIESIHEVPIATLRKWATGKGNARKDEMKLAVYKKFGIEFLKDPGCDKLFAFLLSRYGLAVMSGEIPEIVAARRGKGKRAQQIARKNTEAA